MYLNSPLNLKTNKINLLILIFKNTTKLLILLLIIHYKFLIKILLFFKKKNLFFKKKNLFFKKKYDIKVIISKRLSFAFKKKKYFKKVKKKFKNNGNFFFKKFFFKTLIHCRKKLKTLYYLEKIVRQKTITKDIFKKTKNSYYKNYTHEYTLINILLKGNFFFFVKDIFIFIKLGFVYVNNTQNNKTDFVLSVGDCVQVQVFDHYYNYIIFFKKFLKLKIKKYKQDSWLFFKRNFLNKKSILKKFKKRKNPKYIHILYLYKFNIPQYLDIDFITLTIIILKKFNICKHKTYFLNKNFSWKMFQLYNYKKIN